MTRENFVASHLLKAVHWWTDCGLGEFELCYLRDKMQREVDFLVVKDDRPYMLVECKSSFSEALSPALVHFKNVLNVPLAWQVAFDRPVSDFVPDESTSPLRISVADLLKILPWKEEIPDAGVYMTCAKTLIAPSRWEGMPYLLLEAVARDRRVIASDCPGNRDVLKGCADAALFPVEDSVSLSRLLRNGRWDECNYTW